MFRVRHVFSFDDVLYMPICYGCSVYNLLPLLKIFFYFFVISLKLNSFFKVSLNLVVILSLYPLVYDFLLRVGTGYFKGDDIFYADLGCDLFSIS